MLCLGPQSFSCSGGKTKSPVQEVSSIDSGSSDSSREGLCPSVRTLDVKEHWCHQGEQQHGCVSVCVCVGGYSDAFCGNWPHGTLPLRPAATAEEKKVDVTENPKTKKHLGASFP